jgi:hypothetical protein
MRELIDRVTRVPRTCTWELTLRCNLNCGHCGSYAGTARTDEMDYNTTLRVVGELADLGCEKISLSGGEPLLSPNWADVARAGTRAGMRMNMIVNSACGHLGGLEGTESQIPLHPHGLCPRRAAGAIGFQSSGLHRNHGSLRRSHSHAKVRCWTDVFPKDVPRMVDAYGVPTGETYRDRPPLMDTALPTDTAPSNDIVP